MLLEAAGRREERERKFQARMTANVMNCFGLKHPVTAEMLLGIPGQAGRKNFSAMSGKEKMQALDALWETELKKRDRQARKRLHTKSV